MKSLTDKELLKRMHDGDTGALGVLYMRYAESVSDFVGRFVRVPEDVDDITHNLFCSVWENRDKMDDVESFKGYLFKMSRNAIFKFFRHQSLVSDYASDVIVRSKEISNDAENAVTTADLLEMIDLMISKMPEMQRKIFCMSRFDHLTYAEIAEKLEISPKSVQRYIGLALADLRKLMEAMLIFALSNQIKF